MRNTVAKNKYLGKKFLVIGCGLTGTSIVQRLLDFDIADSIVLFDDKIESCYKILDYFSYHKSLHKVRVLEQITLQVLLSIDVISISPGIYYLPEDIAPTTTFDMQDVHCALQDVEQLNKPFIKCSEIVQTAKVLIFSSKKEDNLYHEIRRDINPNFSLLMASDFDIFNSFLNGPKKPMRVAITGTNGKSTVTSMIYDILRCNQKYNSEMRVAIGGNIGTPCLDLPIYDSDTDFYVFEVSSFQIDLLQDPGQFDIIICTNITSDHLDRYHSFENYILSKFRLFNYLDTTSENCAAILPLNSGIESQMLHNLLSISGINVTGTIVFDPKKEKKLPDIQIDKIKFAWLEISTLNNNKSLDVKQCAYIQEKIFVLHDFRFSVRALFVTSNNLENIGMAIATALNLKISSHSIMEGIVSFQALPHRLEYVLSWRIQRFLRDRGKEYRFEINFIDDSKGTNFAATLNALRNKENIVWIVGGLYKGGDLSIFNEITPKILYSYLIGSSSDFFESFMLENNIRYMKANTLDNALEQFFRSLNAILTLALLEHKDDEWNDKDHLHTINLLLSPACSSLDQWRNFEERGNYFKTKVIKLTSSG